MLLHKAETLNRVSLMIFLERHFQICARLSKRLVMTFELMKIATLPAGSRGDTAAAAQQLLDQGADANQATRTGLTPLMAAVDFNDLPLVEVLLRHGANANTAQGLVTVLMFAASRGNLSIVRLLIKHGAQVTTEELGCAVASAANERTVKAITDVLLDAGRNAINDLDRNGLAPIHRAVGANRLGVIKILLARCRSNEAHVFWLSSNSYCCNGGVKHWCVQGSSCRGSIRQRDYFFWIYSAHMRDRLGVRSRSCDQVFA